MRWFLIVPFLCGSILCEGRSTYGYAEYIGDKYKLYVEESFGESAEGTDTEEAAFFSLHGTVALQILGRRLHPAIDTVFSNRGLALPTYYREEDAAQVVRFDVPALTLSEVRLAYSSPRPLSDAEAKALGEALTEVCKDLRYHYGLSTFLTTLGGVAFEPGEYRKVSLTTQEGEFGYVFHFSSDLTFTLIDYSAGISEDSWDYPSYQGAWFMQDDKVLKLYWLASSLPTEAICPCREGRYGGQTRHWYVKNRLPNGFMLEYVWVD